MKRARTARNFSIVYHDGATEDQDTRGECAALTRCTAVSPELVLVGYGGRLKPNDSEEEAKMHDTLERMLKPDDGPPIAEDTLRGLGDDRVRGGDSVVLVTHGGHMGNEMLKSLLHRDAQQESLLLHVHASDDSEGGRGHAGQVGELSCSI